MHAVQTVLETMIYQADHIYNRWFDGQELPTIVLKHVTDVKHLPDYSNGDSASMYNQQLQFAPPRNSSTRHRRHSRTLSDGHVAA